MDNTIRLNTGALYPRIGFGTWKLAQGEETENAVREALKTGYRLIDTAAIYMNEESVGRAVRESDVPREEFLVTTKLWSGDLGYDRAKSAFQNSLGRLGLDYIDLYLIHWPASLERLEAWRALEELYKDENPRAIGVSNFTVRHLEELREHSHLVPAINQIEFHPSIYKEQREILEYCNEHGIIVEAYSPLAQGMILDHPVIKRVAAAHDKTPAQICLRWCIQHDTIPIPKSGNPARTRENMDVFSFELSSKDMTDINHIGEGGRLTRDPADMD